MRSLLAAALAATLALALFGAVPARAQGCGPSNPNCVVPTPPTTDNSTRAANTAWVRLWGSSAMTLPSGMIWIGSGGNIATPQTPSGDCTLSIGGVLLCTKTNGVAFRIKLTAPTTYYVTAAGVDSDNCTISAPCLTPQRASDNLQKLVDLAGQPVTVSVTNPAPAAFTVSAPYFGDKCAVTFIGDPSITITNATNATPIVITAAGHAYANGMHVVISGVAGNTAANGAFIVAAANIGAGTFALTKEVDSTNVAGTGAYTSGGTVAAPRNNVITASGAGQSAILATNSACFSVQGFSLVSTQAQPLSSFYTSQIYLSGKMDFGASGAGTAQIYATRSGFIEFDDAFSISGATYEFQQASHGGQIRHQNFNGYLTASLTYNNPVDANTAFSLAQGEGQIIETGSTGYTLQGFTVTAQAQFRIFENGNIEAGGLSPPATTYYPGTATGNLLKLGNGTLGPTWWIDLGNNNFYAVAGTGSLGWCVQKNDNSVNLFCVNNGGLATWNSFYGAGVLVNTGAGMYTANGVAGQNIAARFGSFDLFQRGAGGSAAIAVAASTTAYTVDGCYLITAANQASLVSAVAGIAGGSFKAAQVARNNAQTGTGAMAFGCPFDSDEIALFAGQFVTLSFTMQAGANWSPASGNISVFLVCGTGSPKKQSTGYTGQTTPISATQAITSSAVRYAFNSAAIVPATCTQAEVTLQWTPVGTAGAADNFTIDDLLVEIAPSNNGAGPTAFQRISFGQQLALACRHFAKTFPYGTAPAQNAGVAGALGQNTQVATADVAIMWSFPCQQRGTPTITTYNPSAANANWRNVTGSADVAVSVDPNTAVSADRVFIETSATIAAQNSNIYIHATADAGL